MVEMVADKVHIRVDQTKEGIASTLKVLGVAAGDIMQHTTAEF
jgi:hypothetical protein